MAQNFPLVVDFVLYGSTTDPTSQVSFEGWETANDEGNGLTFEKTTTITTPSQLPTDLNDDAITDSEGYVYRLSKNSVLSYNGSNNWFPRFGTEITEVRVYAYTSYGWAVLGIDALYYAEQAEASAAKALASQEAAALSESNVTTLASEVSDNATIASNAATAAQEAQTAAETAQSETEALFNDFDSSVASAVANFNSVPVVDLPLQSGNVIKALNGPLSFSCDAVRYGINASGVLQEYEADEIMFGSDGATLGHPTFTNSALYSDDFSNSAWIKSNCTVSQDSTLGPDLTTECFLVTFTAGQTGYLGQNISSTQVRVLSSVYIKGTAGETIKIESRAVNGSIVEQRVITLTGEWERISTKDLAGDWTAQTDSTVRVSIRHDTVNTANTVYIAGFQAEIGISIPSPYIKTTATAVSCPAAICSTQSVNNLPANGKSFTVEFVATIPDDAANYSDILRNYNYLRIFKNTSGKLRTIGLSGVADSSILFPTTRTRGIVVFDYVNYLITFYIDGVKAGSITKTAETMPFTTFTDPLYIGSFAGSNPLNGSIELIKIYHSALSEEECIAKGAA